LATLPIQGGSAARLSARAAGELEVLSRKLRVYLNSISPAGADGRRTSPERLRERLLKDKQDKQGKRPAWLRAAAVPTLVQMLMNEERPLRLTLVELLAEVPERPATVALAQRAAFDLDAGVRKAAVAALKKRDLEHVRPVLLRALRYPWVPPARNAAEALVALEDREAIPHLVTYLERPDPSRPQVLRNGRTVVQQVVRINHVRNCLMCHPPAATAADPCLGVDPLLTVNPVGGGVSIPLAAGVSFNVSAGGHNYAGRSASQNPLLLRGDITFLRQDFSVQLPVPGLPPAPGLRLPPGQRYDFVVRTRALTPKERLAWKKAPPAPATYPQREAVLRALRGLTGKDAGGKTADWVALFPRAEADVKADRLAKRLVQADPLVREGLVRQHRQGDGEEHTRALARAAARLTGPWRDLVRKALVERLESLPSEVRQLLDDEDPEIRRAASIASPGRSKGQSAQPSQ
jgi:HEAT repeat protein